MSTTLWTSCGKTSRLDPQGVEALPFANSTSRDAPLVVDRAHRPALMVRLNSVWSDHHSHARQTSRSTARGTRRPPDTTRRHPSSACESGTGEPRTEVERRATRSLPRPPRLEHVSSSPRPLHKAAARNRRPVPRVPRCGAGRPAACVTDGTPRASSDAIPPPPSASCRTDPPKPATPRAPSRSARVFARESRARLPSSQAVMTR